jgi:regulator of sigma E protease
MNLLITLIAFIVAISVLVVVHELGHYSVARLCGVKVLRFSVGFGTPLVRWASAKSGTEWVIAALPLGGYVKMLDGRDDTQTIAPTDLPHAFDQQPALRRMAIIAAGPVANFVLAIALLAVIFAAGTQVPRALIARPPAHSMAAQAGLKGGEMVLSIARANGGERTPVRSWDDMGWALLDAATGHTRAILTARGTRDAHDTRGTDGTHDFILDLSGLPSRDADNDDDFLKHIGLTPGGMVQVQGIEAGSAAQRAGLMAGDVLQGVNGQPVDSLEAFVASIQSRANQPVALKVSRGTPAQCLSLTVTPAMTMTDHTGHIGATLAWQTPTVEVRYGPLDSVRLGAQRTWDITVYSLRMFGRMVTGRASLDNLSGPVTIADYAGKSARQGPLAFLGFLAIVSISLGVLNLLPIPVLDGGYLLYYAIEAFTGRTVPGYWQSVLQKVGLVVIAAMVVLALVNDMLRLIH